MAEFNSYLLGKARKSVGNITLCYTRGKNIAKAKVFARKDNPTPEILAQRARMKALVQLSRQLLPVIRKGFAGIGRGSAANAFVKVNMSRVSVDEANVANFADYLKQYSRDTQFIVITHRKGTMERCDALYGVAMEEKGVSRMVSVQLRDLEDQLEEESHDGE